MILFGPSIGQAIGVYLAVLEITISAVLFVYGEENPIFFLIKNLKGPETR